jgi:hypothetical protein
VLVEVFTISSRFAARVSREALGVHGGDEPTMLCALCRSSRELLKSHIFPEFLYRDVYEKGKQFYFAISNDASTPIKRRRQGVYERLLCADCEKLLGIYENYAAKVLYDDPPWAIRDRPGSVISLQVDYARFKLFQLSLIWRAGISSSPEVPTKLFGRHPEKLRNMLLRGDPGRQYEYACIMSFLPEAYHLMRRAIIPPELFDKRIHGFMCYRAMFAGLVWAYFMCGHMRDLPIAREALSESGELRLFHGGDEGLEFIKRIGFEFHSKHGSITNKVHT